MAATCADHSPPRPSNSVTAAPGCRRSTCTWRDGPLGNTRRSPAMSGASTWKRGTMPAGSARAAHATAQPRQQPAPRAPDRLPPGRALERLAHPLLGRAPPAEHANEPPESKQLRLGDDEKAPDQRGADQLGEHDDENA